MDLHENFTTNVSVHKEELIKFWNPSASRSGNFFAVEKCPGKLSGLDMFTGGKHGYIHCVRKKVDP